MNSIKYLVNDDTLKVDLFLTLVNKVWPGDYAKLEVESSLTKTVNITAWDSKDLIGCVRILSDGHFLPRLQKSWLIQLIKRTALVLN